MLSYPRSLNLVPTFDFSDKNFVGTMHVSKSATHLDYLSHLVLNTLIFSRVRGVRVTNKGF
jgi:hypothetical protein